MSIDWENILPEKWSTDEPHCDAFNRCRYESLNALKAAEARGEICKPLSVEELAQLLLDVKMKEMRRNHGGSSYHEEGYKIKEICSCGYCHMSYLEATAIRELMISKLQ